MKKSNVDTKIKNFFSLRVDKDVAILHFQENMLLPLIDLRARDRLVNTIDRLSGDPSIKVILMVHNPYKTGCSEYFDFYHGLTVKGASRNTLRRLGNVANQIVLRIV